VRDEASELLHSRWESKAAVMREFAKAQAEARRAPRGGNAKNFR